jgi:glycosyltransferase involved in cell wall biosynthesis
MPLVSVVIPSYNRKTFVTKTVNSLLNQDTDDYEIIVIDDGSTDGTDAYFQTFKHPKLSYHKIANSERGVARNTGARLAKGDYVNFFDSDDLAYPIHIKTAITAIQKLGEPEILHTNYDLKTADGIDLEMNRILKDNINQLLIYKGNILSCNGVFIKREIALLYPFCESRVLSGTEDYALWLRLSSRFKIHWINQVTHVVIDHEQRSMASHDMVKMINRNMFLLDYLQIDDHFMSYVGKQYNYIEAECFSFISLHLILEEKNLDGLLFLFKAMTADITFPLRRVRFMAIVKHFLRNIFRIRKLPNFETN